MTKAAVTIFEHPQLGQLAAVVMDRDEFDALCDEFKIVMMGVMNMSEPQANAQIKAVKAANTVPMIQRGKQTEQFFTRYDIEINKMSCIVRGQGRQVLNDLIDRVQEQKRLEVEKN